MRPLWMGIVPGPVMTRVLLLDGPHTLLQARLPHGPRHPRAVQTLAEAPTTWLTVAEVATRLKTSIFTVRRMAQSGGFPGAKKMRGQWRIPLAAIEPPEPP